MNDPTYRDGLRTTTRDIAHAILKRDGLTALQARKVAAAANCSVGTLYNVYKNLDDLVIAANAVTLAELGNTLTAARDGVVSTAPLETRLLALADAYLTFAVDNQNGWRAIFEHRMGKNRFAPEWYRAAQGELFAIVETILATTVLDLTERRRAARALFGAVHGIVTLALDEKLGTFDREACAEQVRFIVTTAARGLHHEAR